MQKISPFAALALVALMFSGCATSTENAEEFDATQTEAEELGANAQVRYHCAGLDNGAIARFQFVIGKQNGALRAQYLTLRSGQAPLPSEMFRDVAFRSPRGAAGSLKFRGSALSAVYAPSDAWLVVDKSIADGKVSGQALMYAASPRTPSPFRYTCAKTVGGFAPTR